MKNLVGVCVANATEQMRIGQRTLERVIAAPEYLRERREIGIHHLEPAPLVLGKGGFSLDNVERRLPLGTCFSEDQGSILKIECEQADFAGDCGARRFPSKAPRDHQVKDEKELISGFNDDAFAQPP